MRSIYMLLNYTVQYTADNFWGLLRAIQSMTTQFNLNTCHPQYKAGDTLRLTMRWSVQFTSVTSSSTSTDQGQSDLTFLVMYS